jgi:hypothetical protein
MSPCALLRWTPRTAAIASAGPRQHVVKRLLLPKRLAALTVATLGLWVWGLDVRADTLVLRGGTRLEGELLSYDQKAQEFRFRLSAGAS